ncbi:MAG: hypothetical protein ACXIUP_07590 [Microcella sp.]
MFVVKVGDGFKVHDGSGAYMTALSHGREDGIIVKSIQAECTRFHLAMVGESMVATVRSRDWLRSAILAVANASCLAAHSAVSKIVAVSEAALHDHIRNTLVATVGRNGFKTDVEITGRSGGRRRFDFAVTGRDEDVFINGVSPHHASISSKYVAFADTDADPDHKLAVFDRPLGTDDVALLQQVARIVPVEALHPGLVLDGELYAHGLKVEFQVICSIVGKRRLSESDRQDALVMQFHAFDVASSDAPFSARAAMLSCPDDETGLDGVECQL